MSTDYFTPPSPVDEGAAGDAPAITDLLTQLRSAAHECRATADICQMTVGFFENLPSPSWIKAVQSDGSFLMVHVNAAFTCATGVTAAAYRAQHDAAIWSREVAERALGEDTEVVHSRQPVRLGSVIVHADGRSFRWDGWKWPVVQDGRIVAVCGSAEVTPA